MTLTATLPEQRQHDLARVGVLGMGTAVPPAIPQAQSLAIAKALCCDNEQQWAFMQRVYLHSGVESRGSVLADGDGSRIAQFYPPRQSPQDRGPTTAQRMAVYELQAPQLAHRAALAALAEARLDPAQITHIVCVSCTGFMAPAIDVRLMTSLGLRPDVRRQLIGFMGCHGAFNGMEAAARIAVSDPDARVLLCCVELCSLHLSYGFAPERIVANALFADGAAAAVIGQGDAGQLQYEFLAAASQLLPDSSDAMSWRIGDHGFEMGLSAEVPGLIGRHLRPWLVPWLEDRSVSRPAGWAIHPGGPKILNAVAQSLHLEERDMACSRAVLREHGNMSSGTVLFTLNRLRNAGITGHVVALGFGPGLAAEAMLLHL